MFFIDSTGLLYIRGNGTLNDYSQILQSATFINLNKGIFVDQRIIEFVVSDLEGGKSDPETLLLTIVLFDNPPICFIDVAVSFTST